jgi:hypothetical protein
MTRLDSKSPERSRHVLGRRGYVRTISIGKPVSVANFGITPDAAKAELARAEIAKSFGDVAFGLKVSGIGLVAYGPVTAK